MLTHINENGKSNMVDVSDKTETIRTASAYAEVKLNEEIIHQIIENQNKKGDVLAVAKIAGIQGAKKTSELIPLCHNILIDVVDINFEIDKDNSIIKIFTFAKTTSKTGIEMEAITAASITAITIYDMCKAMSKKIEIHSIRLLSKTGGKSGDYKYE
jgi:cyclic pyranopterin phosphate synthase